MPVRRPDDHGWKTDQIVQKSQGQACIRILFAGGRSSFDAKHNHLVQMPVINRLVLNPKKYEDHDQGNVRGKK